MPGSRQTALTDVSAGPAKARCPSGFGRVLEVEEEKGREQDCPQDRADPDRECQSLARRPTVVRRGTNPRSFRMSRKMSNGWHLDHPVDGGGASRAQIQEGWIFPAPD